MLSDAPARRLGVLGWPVAHSLSPAIHNAALRAAGLHGWRYQLLPVPPELLAETVCGLPAAGFAGVNVTIPHKPAALAIATRPSERARAIGAANTLVFAGGEIAADNTDAPALIAALPQDPSGADVIVLGAGGSARAAIWALRDAGAARVRVWNRTAQRAEVLAGEFGVEPVSAAALAGAAPDILVNCTAVGLRGEPSLDGLPVQASDVGRAGCVVDFVYRSRGTALIAAARAAGVPVVDGLTILIGQGALSFRQFTGREPSLDAMRAAAGNPATADG